MEGHGVDPDIEVELDPYLWRQGKDAQLERAIEEINKLLKMHRQMADMMKQMGTTKVTTKVSSISADPLSDDLFKIPEGYTTIKQ